MSISAIVSRGLGTFSTVFNIVDRGFTPAFAPPPEPPSGFEKYYIPTRGYGAFAGVQFVPVRGYVLTPVAPTPTGGGGEDGQEYRPNLEFLDTTGAEERRRRRLDAFRRELGIIKEPEPPGVKPVEPEPVIATEPPATIVAEPLDTTPIIEALKASMATDLATAARADDLALQETERQAELALLDRIRRDDDDIIMMLAALA